MKDSNQLLQILTAAAIALALCFTAVPAQTQSTVTFSEWAVPSSSNCPFGLVAVTANIIYFTDAPCSSTPKIGMLNTATSTVTEWTGAALASPQGVVALGGLVVFADPAAGTVNVLNTFTNQLTTWALPTPGSGPLRVAALGVEIFFTEQAGRIGMLNPLNNQVTEWTVPGGLHTPLGIAASIDFIWPNWGPRIWFSQASGAQLGMLNPASGTFEQWTIPSTVLSSPFIQGIAVSEQNRLFLGTTGVIGQLDPTTSVLTLWMTPSVTSTPTQLVLQELCEPGSVAEGAFDVDFSDPAANSIGRLLTALQAGTSSTIPVTTGAVTPTVTVVTPTTSALGRTSTVVTPTVTSVAGVMTGGFEEWVVPTSNSNDYALTSLPGGGLAFTEANGNKIGTLRK